MDTHEKPGLSPGTPGLRRWVVFELTVDELPLLAQAEERHGSKRAGLIAALRAEPQASKLGERLPPARDLAAVIGVNQNTVLRALRVLRDEGLLDFRRGRGITVAGTPERGAVVRRARELVSFARRNGYEPQELIEIIEEVG